MSFLNIFDSHRDVQDLEEQSSLSSLRIHSYLVNRFNEYSMYPSIKTMPDLLAINELQWRVATAISKETAHC